MFLSSRADCRPIIVHSACLSSVLRWVSCCALHWILCKHNWFSWRTLYPLHLICSMLACYSLGLAYAVFVFIWSVCLCVYTHTHTHTLAMCLSNWRCHNIHVLLHNLYQSFISGFFVLTPTHALISSVWCCHRFGNVIYSMLNHFWPELLPDREHTVWSLTFLWPQGKPHSKPTTWCSGYRGKQVVTHSQKGY